MKIVIVSKLLVMVWLSPQLVFGQNEKSKSPFLRIAPIQVGDAQPNEAIPVEVTLGVKGWISRQGGLTISPKNIAYIEYSWDGARGGGITIALDKIKSKEAAQFFDALKESTCVLELEGVVQASFLKIPFRKNSIVLAFKNHDAFKRIVQAIEATGAESLAIVDLSIEELTKMISKEPHSASLYYKRAQAYRASGEINLAISDYTSAVNLNPELASAYLWRGRLLDAQKDFKKAIEDFTSAIQLEHSELALVYLLRGLAYLKNGQNKEGYDDLNECVKLDPSMKSVIEATLKASRKSTEQAPDK